MRVHTALISAALCVAILAACSQKRAAEDECTPACGKNCGSDGCGGSCGECDDDLECTDDTCGPQGCYVSIQSFYCLISGACLPSGLVHPSDPCASCQPVHTQEGWTAVEDGVECGAGKLCYQGQCCHAEANCQGKQCGEDGCGGSCGECGEFELCEEGKCKGDCDECNEGQIKCADDTKYRVCQKNAEGCWLFGTQYMCSEQNEFCICQFESEDGICIPEGEPCGCQAQCAGKTCGGDGCGGSCGLCEGVNVVCEDGECTCAGDMCGGEGGCCGANQVCTDELECCTPDCAENDCGEDGCGSVCGMCEGTNVICHEGKCACTGFWCGDSCCKSEQICTGDSVCCTTECGGKDCGDNGCGGVCGVCGPGQLCLNGTCPPPGKDCDDGNDVAWDGCTSEEITEFMVNSTVEEWQGRPRLAGFSDGRYVALWESDKQDGHLAGTFAQRYKADGLADGGEFMVNTTTEDDQHNHNAAAFPSGAWVAVWDSFFQDGNGDGVFGQLYNPDGSKNGTEFQANSHTLSNQQNPDVAVLPDSRFVVVWGGVGEEDWGGVYGRVFEQDGDVDEFLVNGFTTGDQKEPVVASLAGGGFAVAWVSAYQDGSDMGVYGRVFGADGAPAGDEFQVNEFSLGDQEHPMVAGVGDGFVVVWQSEGQDNDGFGIIVQQFNPDGTKAGGESPANAWTVDHQRYPSVSSFADGRYVIAWESKEQDGSGAGVYVRLFEADGNAPNPEFQVNTFTDSNQQTPGVAVLTDSTFAVAWRSWEQGGSGYDIFAARFAVDGSMLYH